MKYTDHKTAEDLKISYVGGGSQEWAWTLMSDLADAGDMSGEVSLNDINYESTCIRGSQALQRDGGGHQRIPAGVPKMRTGIVDFHIHPFLHSENNYCRYKDRYALDISTARARLEGLGISAVCGSVIGPVSSWADIVRLNSRALELREQWSDFYVPGFHIHPDYVQESVAQIEKMACQGIKLLGEVVPYMHGWDFAHPGLVPILEAAQEAGMVFSFHSTGIPNEVMESLLTRFPELTFVAAHPGEKTALMTHLDRMEHHKNYFLDLSGSGLGRMGMLRYAIDRAGKERFLFGTDFPICPPEMYVAVVDGDPLLTEEEKQAVFHGNAQHILEKSVQNCR